ncbi:hypothetical protein AURDEDRAFT_165170 [Auricularia subglabra TFB-10046 SS5]|nr:hypothetical protein AURDEDRAFT_165170 [Auricularia subglabra TFB-10046 SS5]
MPNELPRRLTPSSEPTNPRELDPRAAFHRRMFQNEPASLYPTPRVAKYSRAANWIIIPSVIVYCVFFVDFGDHEHVFSPPRRWLDRQRRAFWSLSPAEQSLAARSEEASPAAEAPIKAEAPTKPGSSS